MSQSVLLTLARNSIEEVLQSQRSIDREALLSEYPILATPHAFFITLIHDNTIRGSSGTLQTDIALIDAIIYHAKIAAFEDTQFPALSTSEYLHTKIELSLLSNALHVKSDSFNEMMQNIKINTQALILKNAENEALFLPQFPIELSQLEKTFNEFTSPEIFIFDVDSARDNAIL